MNFETQRKRSALYGRIRSFFKDRDFLEVDTPLLSSHLIPEASIENFRTRLVSPYSEDIPLFLIPSPELHMKELMAAGAGDIYQICKSFRNSEQISTVHNPEFTMLEWYKTDIDAEENIGICEELIGDLILPETPEACRPPFRRMEMEEAFRELAGFSLQENLEEEALEAQLDRCDIPREKDDDWETLFHKLFLTLVEPELPSDRPLVLTNYPQRIPTLAKSIPGTPWSDRWELYMQGIEIANCYSEETDLNRIRDFYEKEIPEKKKNAVIDVVSRPDWVEKLKGFPESSGTAVGIDRLIASLMGDKSIQGVILFPLNAILP